MLDTSDTLVLSDPEIELLFECKCNGILIRNVNDLFETVFESLLCIESLLLLLLNDGKSNSDSIILLVNVIFRRPRRSGELDGEGELEDETWRFGLARYDEVTDPIGATTGFVTTPSLKSPA